MFTIIGLGGSSFILGFGIGFLYQWFADKKTERKTDMPDPKPVPPDEPLPGDIQDPRNPKPWPQPVPGISEG